MKTPIRFWRGPCGALLCDREITDVTQTLLGETARFYEGTYFIGETITTGAGEAIAKALGGTYTHERPKDVL